MEAVPRLPMLGFLLKSSTENVSFGPKLKPYISGFYNEDPESYQSEIYNLEGLRSSAVRPTIDVSGCQTLQKYYCQLHFLKSRFPMEQDQPAAVNFAWKDNYTEVSCELADINYELMCILFNIGAIHTQLGASDSRVTPEGMKMACTHFQCAAWAFQTLKDKYFQMTSLHLSLEIVHFMIQVCLAQAQECILEKSMLDNRKATIISKVAAQVVDFYRRSLNIVQNNTDENSVIDFVGSKTYKEWQKYLSFKIAYHKCITLLFQGQQAEEQQKMGERVAYYQTACEQLEEARKIASSLKSQRLSASQIEEAITFTSDVVEGKRKAAKNENEFIYHEQVPDKSLLQEIQGASLVKGIAFSINDVEVSGTDIFARLVPLTAHEASSMYSEKKAMLLRQMGELIEKKDQELTEFMSSLQLEIIDQMRRANGLPQEIIDRAAALSAKPNAISDLVNSMKTLSNSYHEVESMLNEIQEIIKEEEDSERIYQEKMGKRPAGIISTDLSREAAKYREAHVKANDSNQTLHKAMTNHILNLKILSQPLATLNEQIPSVDIPHDNINQASLSKMDELEGKVEEMRVQRAMLWNHFREEIHNDDITSVVITRQPQQSLDELFEQELQKHKKTANLIEQNVAAQENILKAFVDAHADFATSKKFIQDTIAKRNNLITSLITTYDTYDDLLNKANKGIEFYGKLEGNVSKLLQRIKSTCKVQQEERDQLLAKSNVNIPQPEPTPPPVSNTPKLKDYLEARKKFENPDVNPKITPAPYPNVHVENPNWSPGIRPTPVGSEVTSEPVVYDGVVFNTGQAPQLQGGMNDPYAVQAQYNPGYGCTYPPNQVHPAAQYPGNTQSIPDQEIINRFASLSTNQKPELNSQYVPPHYQGLSNVSSQLQVNKTPEGDFNTNQSYSSYNQQYPGVYQNTDYNRGYPVTSQMSAMTNTYQGEKYPENSTMTTNMYKVISSTVPKANEINLHQPQPSQSPAAHPNHINPQEGWYNPGVYSSQPIASGPNSGYEYSSVDSASPVSYNQPYGSNYKTQSQIHNNFVPQPQQYIQPPSKTSDLHSQQQPSVQQNIPSQQYTNMNQQLPSDNNYPVQQQSPAPYNNTQSYSYSYGGNQQLYMEQNPSLDQPGTSTINNGSIYGLDYHPSPTMPAICNQALAMAEKDYGLNYNNTYNPGYNTNYLPQEYYSLASTANYSSGTSTTPSSDYQGQNYPPAAPEQVQQNYYTENKSQTPQTNINYSNVSTEGSFAINQNPNPQTPKSAMEKESYVDLLSGLDFSINQAPLVPEQPVKEKEKPAEVVRVSKTQPKVMPNNDEEVMKNKHVVVKKSFGNSEVKKLFAGEIDKFEKYVDLLGSKTLSGPTNLEIKWKEIQDKQDCDGQKRVISVARCYPLKNRSADILPYDHSRVELASSTDDYINASWIKDISIYAPSFIITQAPLPSTYGDFWAMIYDKQVEVIACLLNENEVGNEIYWPQDKDSEITISRYVLSLKNIIVKPCWIERYISLGLSEKRDSRRMIVHLQYTAWPGSIFPTNPEPFVSFTREFINFNDQQRFPEHPMVVHCSSGIGRSGLLSLLTIAMLDATNNPSSVPDLTNLACKLSLCRRNVLRDREHLRFAYCAFLAFMKSTLSTGEKKKFEEVPSNPNSEESTKSTEVIEGTFDPLSALDPFWASKRT